MANYVSNRIVCKKSFYKKCLLDKDSGDGAEPYITFRKLFGIGKTEQDDYTINRCGGIAYGFGFNVREIDEGRVVITLQTYWLYPIEAILRAISISHDVVWYAVEENWIYISKFVWRDNKVIEETLHIDDKRLDKWYGSTNMDLLYDALPESDDVIWYFDYENKNGHWDRGEKGVGWIVWETDDLVGRYSEDYPCEEYEKWYKKVGRRRGKPCQRVNGPREG